MIIVCDIDNCISDDLHRHNSIDWTKPQGRERYHDYHTQCIEDRPYNLDKLRYPEAAIFFLTAMPQEYSELRQRWLNWHGIHYERILYRNDDHHLNSVEVKRRMVHKLLAEGIPLLTDCVAAYDDRRAVVEMYKSEGLPGIHLQITEQEHLHRVV